MPGEIVLKCAQCGATTRYKDVTHDAIGVVTNHKMDCSQRLEGHPRLTLTFQATEPLVTE